MNPGSTLRDAFLSALVTLAALVACVGVLYLFAPVEWPTFDAARVIAQDEP